jgi:flagellar biosynthesis/type III secretory pathway protein FliH
MIHTRINNTIKGLAFAGAMVFGVMMFSPTQTAAQSYGYYQNDRHVNTQAAYSRGYREGFQRGQQAARNGYGYENNYSSNDRYSYGYNNSYGSNGSMWQQAYQNGFNRGYREGYSRNRRNNRSGFTIRLPF